jgi:hypothetical protein
MGDAVELRVLKVTATLWEQAWMIPEMVEAELVLRPETAPPLALRAGVNGKSLLMPLAVLAERGSFKTYFGPGQNVEMRRDGELVEMSASQLKGTEVVRAKVRVPLKEYVAQVKGAVETFQRLADGAGCEGDETMVNDDIEATWKRAAPLVGQA